MCIKPLTAPYARLRARFYEAASAVSQAGSLCPTGSAHALLPQKLSLFLYEKAD